MRREGDKLILSDGTEIRANCGILGLSEAANAPGEPCWPTEGYDGTFWSGPLCEENEKNLSPAHRKEIGDYMIRLWTLWRDDT